MVKLIFNLNLSPSLTMSFNLNFNISDILKPKFDWMTNNVANLLFCLTLLPSMLVYPCLIVLMINLYSCVVNALVFLL